MPVLYADVVAKNIKAFGDGFCGHVNKCMETVQNMLDTKVTENMSQADHTLADLARLDHPYAKRHGPEGLNLHTPYYQVHIQSGRLLASKRSGTVKADISGGVLSAKAWCGVYERGAPYAAYVIYGTSRQAPGGSEAGTSKKSPGNSPSGMIARDFLTGSLNEVKDEAVAYLHTNLRDFIFNFKGTMR